MQPFIKVKKFGQAHAGAGWNQHVNHWTGRYANKVIRRYLNDEINEQLEAYDPPRHISWYEYWSDPD